jgi:hypothetical protein
MLEVLFTGHLEVNINLGTSLGHHSL